MAWFVPFRWTDSSDRRKFGFLLSGQTKLKSCIFTSHFVFSSCSTMIFPHFLFRNPSSNYVELDLVKTCNPEQMCRNQFHLLPVTSCASSSPFAGLLVSSLASSVFTSDVVESFSSSSSSGPFVSKNGAATRIGHGRCVSNCQSIRRTFTSEVVAAP